MQNCPYCDRENTDDAAHCRECGTAIAAEPESAQAADPHELDDPVRELARKRMLHGAVWCLGGILVTIFSYAAATSSPRGGTYIIAWGAIVYGALQFVRGLSGRDDQPGTEEIAYEELAGATKLEIAGHIQEALKVYERVAGKYPHTDAGRDAKKSIESLQARLG